jgi:hypothetical protein
MPDLSGIDPTELQLTILAELDRRGLGPEFRMIMRDPQFGDLLDLCGGAKQVLAAALAAIRRDR